MPGTPATARRQSRGMPGFREPGTVLTLNHEDFGPCRLSLIVTRAGNPNHTQPACHVPRAADDSLLVLSEKNGDGVAVADDAPSSNRPVAPARWLGDGHITAWIGGTLPPPRGAGAGCREKSPLLRSAVSHRKRMDAKRVFPLTGSLLDPFAPTTLRLPTSTRFRSPVTSFGKTSSVAEAAMDTGTQPAGQEQPESKRQTDNPDPATFSSQQADQPS